MGMVKSGAKVIGYVRVSTREQGESGLGLDAQRRAIESECERRGWILEHIYEDVATGSNGDRVGITTALAALDSGLVSGLVVAKMDRLTRSLLDLAAWLKRSADQGWALVALDLGVDTSTPAGRMVAKMMGVVAEWERETIAQRTKVALAEKRERGESIGRPSRLPADVLRRIQRERADGTSLAAIARGLDADGVPTGQGGKRWYPSTVAKLLASEA